MRHPGSKVKKITVGNTKQSKTFGHKKTQKTKVINLNKDHKTVEYELERIFG